MSLSWAAMVHWEAREKGVWGKVQGVCLGWTAAAIIWKMHGKKPKWKWSISGNHELLFLCSDGGMVLCISHWGHEVWRLKCCTCPHFMITVVPIFLALARWDASDNGTKYLHCINFSLLCGFEKMGLVSCLWCWLLQHTKSAREVWISLWQIFYHFSWCACFRTGSAWPQSHLLSDFLIYLQLLSPRYAFFLNESMST